MLRIGALRASAQRERGTPGPEGSVLKMGGALLDQRIQAFTVGVLGPAGTLSGGYDPPPRDDPVDHFLASQSETIAGGTTEVMKNILGERGPRTPDRGEGRSGRAVESDPEERLNVAPWNI